MPPKKKAAAKKKADPSPPASDNKKSKKPQSSRSPSPQPEKKKQTTAYSAYLVKDPEFQDFRENAHYSKNSDIPTFPYPASKTEVDKEFYFRDDYAVYVKDGQSQSATMNSSSMVGGSNTNKFYLSQVLYEKAKPQNFYLFKRWGRVGEPGSQALIGPRTEQEILLEYNKKVMDKVMRCKYEKIEIEEDDDEGDAANPNAGKDDSTLDVPVQNLMNLIFDTNVQAETMKEIGYDPKKCPLGKLATSTIQDGYKTLNLLMMAVKAGSDKKQVEQLSSDFYTSIPHDFGRQKMKDFILDTEDKIKEKLNMLQSLTDMKIANDLMSKKSSASTNILDQNYRKLNCKLRTLTKSEEMYGVINKFIDNTKRGWRTEISDIFEVTRPGEKERFREDIGNKQLLWHGSRVSNYVGILSQGLRIAPPEAPVSGYLYGKGIYLADMFEKSAHYCRGGTSNGEILIMLIESALGVPRELHRTDSNAGNLPSGTHSTLGWGTNGPDPKQQYTTSEGVKVPYGKPTRTASSSYMSHNEFIVYNVNQAQIKYLIRLKLN